MGGLSRRPTYLFISVVVAAAKDPGLKIGDLLFTDANREKEMDLCK